MKLRFKGNSLRLRVSRSELATLQAGGYLRESVYFPGDPAPSLSYVLAVGSHDEPVRVGFHLGQIAVSVSPAQLRSWSEEDQVGVYASLPVTDVAGLEIALEKDFACLDLSDEDNKDAFANPLAGKAC
jgi:hypothetical protein